MVELSIIIVSYKNQQVLIECLDSVLAFNDIGDGLEVIVVEQSPDDNIFNYLIEHYPNVRTIRSENRGFGAGNNRGSEIAQGRYLLFLNPDTVLIEPVAQFAIDQFDNNPTIGLFGVRLLDSQKKKSISFDSVIPYGLFPIILSQICNRLSIFLEDIMYIQGADLFIRADLFSKVGMFDEDVFMYFEEPDLCIRIRKENYHIKFFSNKRIIHLQGACSPKSSEHSCLQMLESFKHMCGKYGISYIKYLKEGLDYQQYKLLFLRIFRKNAVDEIEMTQGTIRAINKFLEND